jgi:uncharacterized SAM-binding protein YcdF (DUF218 family)
VSDIEKFNTIFKYLSEPSMPVQEAPVAVFGRNDMLVAQKAAQLVRANLASVLAITGGFGKDSGDLRDRGYRSEAHYLEKMVLAQPDLPKKPIILLDEKATNGGENARNSLALLYEHDYFTGTSAVTGVIHATSARRLAATLQKEIQNQDYPVDMVNVAPTDYAFDPENLIDQHEATGEMVRLVDYAKNNFIVAQTDLPEDLLDFSRDVYPALHEQFINL